MRLARLFAEWVDASERFERLAPVPLSVVCFRARPAGYADGDGEGNGDRLDALNARVLETVNASGEVFLSHTRIDGRYALRLAVGHIRTQERHVARAWALLQDAATKLGRSPI
jgi:aromatic-L-amino-acid decarboxylase